MDYFIADTHFFHENVIRFDKRPFTSVEEINAKFDGIVEVLEDDLPF